METQIQDSFFGALRIDPNESNGYSTIIDFFPKTTVEVTISFDDIGDEPHLAVIERAKKVYITLQSRQEATHRALVNEYLAEYNLYGIYQKIVSQEEFLDRMKLDHIYLMSDGSCLLYFVPEGLEDYFGDHAVRMSITPKLEIEAMNLV